MHQVKRRATRFQLTRQRWRVGKSTKKTTRAKKVAKTPKKATKPKAEGPREGSKTALVVAMLQRKNGVTLAEIMDKMSWQKHTVRG